MKDEFDEFMRQLRRRQGVGEAAGRPDGEPADETGSEGEAEGPVESDEPERGGEDVDQPERRRADERADEGIGGRPPFVRIGRRRAGRGVGRSLAWLIVLVGLVLVIWLLSFGIDLWTDALWFDSVGFASVFWTRIGSQLGLFALVATGGLVLVLATLWLAGRLAPPSSGRAGSIGEWLSRLEAAVGPLDRDTGYRAGARGERETLDPFEFGRGMASGYRRGRRPRRPEGDEGQGDPEMLRRHPGSPYRPGGTEIEGVELPDFTPLARWVIGGMAILVTLSLAAGIGGRWETVALWLNRVPFSPDAGLPVTDPVFGRDISFFLFDLPFLRLVQSGLNAFVLLALAVAGARYAVTVLSGAAGVLSTPVRVHLAVLGALVLLSIAVGYQLDKFELSYSTRGATAFMGVHYTDQNAQFLAYDVLSAITALTAAFLIGGAFTRLLWPIGLAVVVWFGAFLVLGRIYPEVVQRFSVVPNEYALEERFISNNISMTKLAYGLTGWEVRSYRGDAPLSEAKIAQEQATFENARLWDYRPLNSTLDQLQTVRQYYDFVDVDTDRYELANRVRQVMLSARELSPEKIPPPIGWVNERITFTHGFGLAMVPVNQVTREGLPELVIRDLPPIATAGAPPVNQPRIYFGERPSGYVIVGARQPEFDYPIATEATSGNDQTATTTWTGTTGIRLDSTLTRLLFAARFRDLNLLISDQITSASQLLFHRSIGDRLRLIAPFLRYDKDPYLVVTSAGRLVYIQDAYTISDRFPNANPFNTRVLGASSGLAGESLNYIRNSVKIVMDAYDGSLSFYAADPGEPLLRAYTGIFPGLFRPLADMPGDLRSHLRVPEELFNVQTRVYATYHITDPQTFYRQEDLWTVPEYSTKGTEQVPPEAYYVIMRMPGEAEAEFLLLQPMVPQSRPNMIAWVAARNDAPNYGTVRVFQFPRDTSIFGPAQIEARIDQDPLISAQFTLWGQVGSKVIRGNLIVVPVQDSLIYLEPIYLQSTSAQFPEFQRIIVATPTQVVWGSTLDEALERVLAEGPSPTPSPSPSPSPTGSPAPTASPPPSPTASPSPTPTRSPGGSPSPSDEPFPDNDVAALIEYANRHFEFAQAALKSGDFARYGAEIALVERALHRLAELARPSPSP